jgi:sugar lactone lactonase YvrE
MVGVVVDSAGSVYALVASQDETNGVWWVSPDGSTVVQFARLPAGAFPNDLIIDTAGRIYVTDSVGGRIFRVTGNDGAAEVWAQSPLLLGNVESPGPIGMPIGANGIALAPGGQAVYVAVSEQESIVRIPIRPDGSAGAATVVAEDDDLAGVDGIDVGPTGLIYGAVNEQNQIVTVDPATGRVSVVASGSEFHFPAVLRFSPDGSRYYVTNFDAPVLLGLAPGPARTGLLVIDTAPGTGIAPPRTGDGGLAE